MNWLSKLTSGSAESVISLMLLGVCVAVGLAAWFLWSDTSVPEAAEVPTARAVVSRAPADAESGSSAAEQAALQAWQNRLEGTVTELEAKRRLRQQQEESARKEREQVETAARLRRLREEQAQLDAQRRETDKLAKLEQQSQARAKPVAQPEANKVPDILEEVLAREPERRQPERTEASVDWSTCKPPQYPDSALRRGQEGATLLEFQLDAAGKVQSGRVLQSSGFTKLDEVAETAIGKCRFHPATINGAPEASIFQTRFVWKIEQ